MEATKTNKNEKPHLFDANGNIIESHSKGSFFYRKFFTSFIKDREKRKESYTLISIIGTFMSLLLIYLTIHEMQEQRKSEKMPILQSSDVAFKIVAIFDSISSTNNKIDYPINKIYCFAANQNKLDGNISLDSVSVFRDYKKEKFGKHYFLSMIKLSDVNIGYGPTPDYSLTFQLELDSIAYILNNILNYGSSKDLLNDIISDCRYNCVVEKEKKITCVNYSFYFGLVNPLIDTVNIFIPQAYIKLFCLYLLQKTIVNEYSISNYHLCKDFPILKYNIEYSDILGNKYRRKGYYRIFIINHNKFLKKIEAQCILVLFSGTRKGVSPYR